MAKTRTASAIADRTVKLGQETCACLEPLDLLRLALSPIDEEGRRTFSDRSSDMQTGAISLGVVCEPATLAAEIVINFSGSAGSGSVSKLVLAT